MKNIYRSLSVLALSLTLSLSSALAEDVVIKSAKFEPSGKLKVVLNHPGIEGCYLAVYGGLNATSLETLIVATRTTPGHIAADKVTIKTKRKYYCKKRTLFVEVQRICLEDTSLISTSAVVKVSVPSQNIKK